MSKWAPPEWAKLPLDPTSKMLEVWKNGELQRKIDLGKARHLTIGRQQDLAHVHLEDASVSRQHAAVINSSSSTFVMDLKSAQGTYLGDSRVAAVPQLGTRIEPGQPVELEEGQTIRLGSCAVVFRVTNLAIPTLDHWSIPAWCTLPVFAVSISGGPKGGELRRDLSQSRGTLIGRSEERSDIAIPDGSVSRLHAAITHDEETSYVVDLGSAHGTFVDSVRLAANSFHTLHDGARVAFGTAPFDYVIHVNTSRRGAPSSVGQQGSTPKRHRS